MLSGAFKFIDGGFQIMMALDILHDSSVIE